MAQTGIRSQRYSLSNIDEFVAYRSYEHRKPRSSYPTYCPGRNGKESGTKKKGSDLSKKAASLVRLRPILRIRRIAPFGTAPPTVSEPGTRRLRIPGTWMTDARRPTRGVNAVTLAGDH